MDPFILISLAGGLALFLYGMSTLGSGLEKLSGGALEKTLEKMTSNVFKSVLLGALVTACIQSSSATTVIVVGLVNAGILKLRSAVGVIMGANIGTTITGQILRLGDLNSNDSMNSVLSFLKPTTLAPIIAIIGILLFMGAKRNKLKVLGEICLGFGVLFTGMFQMTNAVQPLSESPVFRQMFSTLSNPFLGILAGTIVTAIIQSSSASIGILQAIASTGAINYSAAFPIILGQNIGTCVTSLLASIGTSKNAKRTAMVHLYFNLIGTILFFIAVYTIKAAMGGFPFWDSPIDMGGIANVHTTFNIIVTLVFLPFTRFLEKLAIWTIRDKDGETPQADEAAKLDSRFLVAPSLALEQCSNVLTCMGELACDNFQKTLRMLHTYDTKTVEIINENENSIDRMEDKVNNYLLRITDHELTDDESRLVTHQLKIVSEFERVGDYTINMLECAQTLFDKQIRFSPEALKEMDAICAATNEIIGISLDAFTNNDYIMAKNIEPLEETIDIIQDSLKYKHIDRLKNGSCTIETGVVFLELLSNIERISDHCSNIGVYIIGYNSGKESLNRHEYIKQVHYGEEISYATLLEKYRKKFFTNM